MAKEIKEIIEVDIKSTGEKTIKSLREEITNLRNKLLNTVQTSEEYTQICEQISDIQTELNSVMHTSSEKVEDLGGSYNALSSRLSELKKEWKATNDEARRAVLGTEISDINSKLKEMDASIGNFQRNVGSYEQSFGQAMSDMREDIEPSLKKFESLQKMASGLSSGFAAFQGVLALTGIESKNFEQTLIKLQSAMAIAQGIGGLKDLVEGARTAGVAFGGALANVKNFITGLKGLKLALAASGVGLFVAALGALTIAFIKLKDSVDEVTRAREKFDAAIKESEDNIIKEEIKLREKQIKATLEYSEAIKNANGNRKALLKAEEDYNAKIAEIEASRLKNTRNSKEELLKIKDEEIKALEEKQRELKNNNKERVVIASPTTGAFTANVNNDSQLTKVNEELEKAKKERLTLYQEYLEAQQKVLDNENLASKESEENNIEILEEYNKRMQELLDEELKAQEKGSDTYINILKKIEEEEKKSINSNESIFKNRFATLKESLNELDDEMQDKLDTISSSEKEPIEEKKYTITGYEIDTSLDSDVLAKKYEQVQANLKAEYDIMLNYHNLKMDLIDEELKAQEKGSEEYNKLLKERDKENKNFNKSEQQNLAAREKAEKEYEEEEKTRKKKLMQYSLQMASSTFKQMSEVMGEESKAGKAFAVAGALIDTYQAANSAYASMASIPVVGPALGAAAAAAAIVAGIKNVQSIIAVDEENPNANVTPNVASNTIARPQINLDDVMPTTLTQNLMTDSELTQLNASTKVYVVESDITDTQKKVELAETNASF